MLKILSFFLLEKCMAPGLLKTKNAQVEFEKKPLKKINSLKKQNQWYLIHTWSDNAFKGTVVNRALLSLHGTRLT